MSIQDEQQDYTPDIRSALDAMLMENLSLDEAERQLLARDDLDPDDVIAVVNEYLKRSK